jgi:hypothetical protein
MSREQELAQNVHDSDAVGFPVLGGRSSKKDLRDAAVQKD